MLKRTENIFTEFLDFLVRDPKFSPLAGDDFLTAATTAGCRTYHDLWDANIMPGRDLADAIARFHQLPRAERDEIAACPHRLDGLSRRFLRGAWLYPYDHGDEVALAIADPSQGEAISAVELAFGRPLVLRIASFEDIEALFTRADHETDHGDAAAGAVPPGRDADILVDEDLERLQDLAHGAPVVRAVDAMLEKAIELHATDIHIEPSPDTLTVRFRVDGFLRKDRVLPVRMARAIVSRVKIIAGLNITEQRLPQDGRARVRIRNVEADLRVATMPSLHGEGAVIRILVKEARLHDFSRLGLAEADETELRRQLDEPHGLIVVSGPTGSGKTTTLAAALSLLNDPRRKILTIEDPIEYQIPGIHQTQIKPSINLTFATALRAFLRQDPDVIMVGEMRDTETARIAIQAALTGHLVLTTLHTNTAADAVVRLLDMGVESFLLASALRCVVGQRLVRRLCTHCARPADPAAMSESNRLLDHDGSGSNRSKIMNLTDANRSERDPGGRDGPRQRKPVPAFPDPVLERYGLAGDDRLMTAVGCDWCGGTGYSGRVGIFEVMKFDDALNRQIRSDANPGRIQELAREAGMTTMLEDGVSKCRKGLVTLEEVLRVTS